MLQIPSLNEARYHRPGSRHTTPRHGATCPRSKSFPSGNSKWGGKISLNGNHSTVPYPHDIPTSQLAACMSFPGNTERCSPYFCSHETPFLHRLLGLFFDLERIAAMPPSATGRVSRSSSRSKPKPCSTRPGLGTISLEETRVYASFEPGREMKFKGWLHNFLDKQPGIRVFAVERHWKKHTIHCRACRSDFSVCPSCKADLGRAAEKTVDSRIGTDMLSLAWEGAYDVALLLSSDRDFLPAVDKLQSKNHKVVIATWRGHGHELAKVCWASFELDSVIQKLKRWVRRMTNALDH